MLNVTDLTAYLYCPRKLFLAKVLKLKEKPKEVMVLGSIRHRALESLNKQEEKIVKEIDECRKELVQETYSKNASLFLQSVIAQYKTVLEQFQLPLEEVLQQQWNFLFPVIQERALHTFQFAQQNQILGKELWEQLTPKMLAEVAVSSPSWELKGIVDQIEVYPDALIPVEVKTGKAPSNGMWDDHRIQLGAYIYLTEATLQKPSREGKIKYLATNATALVQRNPFLEQEILKIRDRTKEVLETKALPERCGNERKCRACGFRERCYNDAFMEERVKEVLAKA